MWGSKLLLIRKSTGFWVSSWLQIAGLWFMARLCLSLCYSLRYGIFLICSIYRRHSAGSGFFLNFYFLLDCSWITMCCVSFRCTAKWLSYKYTYIHFFQILFAFRILQDIEQIVPMLYSKSLLVIYFFQDYVYFY